MSFALDTELAESRAAAAAAQAPRLFAAVRVLLLATLLAAPLAFGAVQPWAWGTLAVMAFSLLLLWSVAGVQQGAVTIVWSALYLPAACFFLLGTIQLLGHLTLDALATREALLKFAAGCIFFFLASQLLVEPGFSPAPPPRFTLARTHRRLTRAGLSPFGLAVFVYTVLLALFAIFQFFSSHGLIYWTVKTEGWPFGPYVNHNHYAGLMEMLIPVAAAAVWPAMRRGPAALFLGFLVLIPVASLLLSGSRGGFIALAVEVLLAAILVGWRGAQRTRRRAAAAGALAMMAAALLFFWMAPPSLVERLETIADTPHAADVQSESRLAVSRDALRIFRDHPWTGAGLGSFETAFPQYQSFPSDLTWDHAHNDYAEALAETGIAGGALILAALGLFFWLVAKGACSRLRYVVSDSGRHGSVGSVADIMSCGAAIGCCGLFVHSLVDFNLHMPANAAWFAVCVAIATAGSARPCPEFRIPISEFRRRSEF
jgi:O-antigen ligase